MMRRVKIEDLEICEGENPRQLAEDDLDLLEKMNQEWKQKNNQPQSKKPESEN